MAIGVCGSAAEIFETPALSVLAASFPGDCVQAFEAPLAGAAARWASERQPTTAFVHGDPRRSTAAAGQVGVDLVVGRASEALRRDVARR